MPNSQEDPDCSTSDEEFFIPKSCSLSKANTSEKETAVFKGASNKTSEEKCKAGAHTLLIYLKSRAGHLVPHILYIIEVTNRITLSILCELTPEGIMSGHIASLIKQMNNLQYHPLSRNVIGSFDVLENEFKSLTELLWKNKKLLDKEKYIKKLLLKWEQLKQSEIESFIAMSKEKLTNPRLESGLSSCCDLLKTVFEDVIAHPCLRLEEKSRTFEHQEILKSIQKISVKRFNDITDFIEVKAVQNITMSSYISDYPGLIHFIYVDRSCDCLIAPCITLKKTHLNGTPSLKRKIWKMVATGRKYIDGANNFCSLWKHDDLNFFYNVWFEDSTGRVIKPVRIPNLKNFPKKGIICGNFYNMLIKECFPDASYDHILCYEFFCAHLCTTPSETIIEHSKKLCAQLWHFSGAYRTSLDLL